MFGCKHKYAEIKDGYQYCDSCGVAKAAPVRECEHKWRVLDRYEKGTIFNDLVHTHIYMMQCDKCGDITKTSTA